MPESPSLHAGDGYPRGGPEAQNGRLDLYDSAPSGPSGVERLRSLLGTLWGGKWILLGVFALVVSAADDSLRVDLGGRRILKKKNTNNTHSFLHTKYYNPDRNLRHDFTAYTDKATAYITLTTTYPAI